MSTVEFDTWANGAGDSEDLADVSPARAKAYVSLNQESAGHPASNTFNIASTTDSGTGESAFELTNAMSVSTFTCATTLIRSSAHIHSYAWGANVDAVSLDSDNGSGTLSDNDRMQCSIHGTLA